MSFKQVADAVGLAASTVYERVRRLRQAKVLLGTHARVDPAALGIGLEAMISVRLGSHGSGAIPSFERHLDGLPEVVAWYNLAGRTDYMVHVAVRDPAHLQQFTLDSILDSDVVDHVETALIFSHHRAQVWPDFLAAET